MRTPRGDTGRRRGCRGSARRRDARAASLEHPGAAMRSSSTLAHAHHRRRGRHRSTGLSRAIQTFRNARAADRVGHHARRHRRARDAVRFEADLHEPDAPEPDRLTLSIHASRGGSWRRAESQTPRVASSPHLLRSWQAHRSLSSRWPAAPRHTPSSFGSTEFRILELRARAQLRQRWSHRWRTAGPRWCR
jgi:hypothetical protein